jgi:hypothetical protein
MTKAQPLFETKFDEQVYRLGLVESEWCGSTKLRAWVEDNRNRRFVPEWLLGAWGLTVKY